MGRIIFLVLVSIVPFSRFRRILYNTLFGFEISKTAKIGILNLLDTQALVMKDYSEIRGIGNIFLGVHRLEMDQYSRIGGPRVGLNLFRGTANKKDYPSAVFKIGKCSAIELFHYFDLCGDIIIGENVVIGGIRSVFFTHSFYKSEFEPIKISSNVYIGSNCVFQMGTIIPENSVVGIGSVVVKPIKTSGSLIAGVPAVVVKENLDFRSDEAFKLRKKVYYKNGEFIHPL